MARDSGQDNSTSWEKHPQFGHLVGHRTGPLGQLVIEKYFPKSEFSVTLEVFPNSRRQLIKKTGKIDDGVKNSEHRALASGVYEPYVLFLNKAGDSYTKIVAGENNDSATITASAATYGIESGYGHEEAPQVKLEYSANGLEEARFSPEPQINTLPDPEEFSGSWKDNLSLLAGYINTSNADEKETRTNQQLALRDKISNIGGQENPQVLKSLAKAREIYEGMLEQIPLDDREKYQTAFEKICLFEQFAIFILLEDVVHKDIETLDPNELINETFQLIISNLKSDTMKDFDTLFVVNSFDDELFFWKQLEVETPSFEEIEEAEPKENVITLTKETVAQEGKTSYGNAISIQDHTYSVSKNGDLITVICTTAQGKKRWTSTFPLSLDTTNICLAVKNPTFDFREIKNSAQVELKAA